MTESGCLQSLDVRKLVGARGVVLAVPTLAFIACTALKDGSELPPSKGGAGDTGRAGATPDLGGAGAESDSLGGAGAGAAGGPIAGSGGDAGSDSLGGAGAGMGPVGGAGAGMSPTGGAGAGMGGEPNVPDPDCGSVKPTGKTYYFCACDPGADERCEPGSDGAAGTDPDLPLQSYSRAQTVFGAMAAGDQIAFCRGGAWQAEPFRRWSNEQCSADTPCTIGAYTPPWDETATAKAPLIDSGSAVGFELSSGSGYQLLDLALIGTGTGVSVAKGVSDVLLCHLDLDGYERGVVPSDGGGTTWRVELRESTIKRSKRAAVVASSPCIDCVIADSSFEQNGVSDLVAAAGDTIEITGGELDSHLRITGNTILTQSGPSGGRCFASGIRVDGNAADGVVIDDNRFEDISSDDMKGVDCGRISMGGSDPAVLHAQITRNRFMNGGAVAVTTVYCDDCVIENNVVARTKTIRDEHGELVRFFPFNSNGSTNGLIFRNNTAFVADGVQTGDATIFSLWPGGTYTGFVSANNLVLFRAVSDYFAFMVGPPGMKIFDFANNNLCFYPNATTGVWIQDTLSQWVIDTENDKQSLNADPQIVETPGPTFLQPSSASSRVVGKGAAAQSPAIDIDGAPRHSPPDIGAYEH